MSSRDRSTRPRNDEWYLRGEDEEQRPTAKPPFDPAQYARESEHKMRVAEGHERHESGTGKTTQMAATPLDSIVVIAVAREDLEWFDLAPNERALLERVDGTTSVAGLLGKCADISDAARLLLELNRQGILDFVPRSG